MLWLQVKTSSCLLTQPATGCLSPPAGLFMGSSSCLFLVITWSTCCAANWILLCRSGGHGTESCRRRIEIEYGHGVSWETYHRKANNKKYYYLQLVMGVGAGKASLVGMSWRFVEGVFLGGFVFGGWVYLRLDIRSCWFIVCDAVRFFSASSFSVSNGICGFAEVILIWLRFGPSWSRTMLRVAPVSLTYQSLVNYSETVYSYWNSLKKFTSLASSLKSNHAKR